MNEAINFGVVGCGIISRFHLKGLATLKDEGRLPLRLVAVCDVDSQRAEGLAQEAQEKLGLLPTCFTDYEKMLHQSDLSAVGIYVHHSLHHDIAQACLAAGKHVLLEKPLAIAPSLGRDILRAATGTGPPRRAGLVLAVAENYRRSPLNRAVKAALSDGLIGKVYFLLFQFASVGSDIFCGTPWRHMVHLGGAGPVFDNGVHDADLFLYWLGDVEEVFAYNATFEKTRRRGDVEIVPTAEDTDVAVLKFKSGVLGQWLCSWAGHAGNFGQNVIFGSEGRINLSQPEARRETGETLDGQQLVERYAPNVRQDTFATELEDFAEAILHRRKPEVDGYEGLRAMGVSYAALESARTGKPVKVEDVLEGRATRYEESVLALLGK